MLRSTALLLVIGAALAAGPAAAQFGNLFGPPPRPPADVPDAPFPPQPPPPQYPPYPGQAPRPAYPAPASAPPSGIQTQPLPPPPGASLAPPPAQGNPPRMPAPPAPAARTGPPPTGSVTPEQSPASAGQSPDTPPSDDTVVETPTQKIENGRAVFSGLDKITGRTISFDVALGETVQFGALQVTPRACYTRPPTEATNTDAFVEVDEVTLKGEIKRIFTGWMFASSPGLHAVEHPIYDVWLTDCAAPVQTKVAEPVAPPAPAPTTTRPRPAPRR